MHQLKEFEEIIGVYGHVSYAQKRITTIAFIVKAPHKTTPNTANESAAAA